MLEEERYSETLDRHFAHRVLRIGYNYKGLTEIGGLVVRPEFRRHPERLGRLLAYVRFLYMARHRPAFRDEVLSELMPPLEPDGTSLLWESLGRQLHRPHAIRRRIGCRRTTRSSSARCSPRIRST